MKTRKPRKTRVYSYVVAHDVGFAPNPFFNVCTLACCKADIRKSAEKGDYILGLGSVLQNLSGHICYWMEVTDITSFDKYWDDPQFEMKRARMNGPRYMRYGDNIYHRENGVYRQEHSFHSLPGGELSIPNRDDDTGKTDKVLVSRNYAHYGKDAIELPSALAAFDIRWDGYKCNFPDEEVAKFIAWTNAQPERGLIATPVHWEYPPGKGRRKPKRRKLVQSEAA